MGGNLFKLGRLPRREYLEIESEIRHYLDKKLGAFYRIPRYYGDKPDFGDLDIIVSDAVLKKDWDKIRGEIIADLGVTQSKAIGHVFSTVYKNFQVDYFLTPEASFETLYNFFCFNDLGNLLGKICRRFNLKHGQNGLAYVFRRNDGNYKKDLLLTTDFAEICRFLQVDYEKWKAGFANLPEMFEWVMVSPYFSVEPYLNPSKTLENRAQERTTMAKFFAYVKENKITKAYPYLENRDDYIPWIAESFPAARLIEKIAAEKELERQTNHIREKFNGQLLMRLRPDLEGKKLGEFIIGFKRQFSDFDGFILKSSPAEINEAIIEFSRKFK